MCFLCFLGEEVNWVQCDRCEQWFHMLCVGLAEEDISENEDYICFNCSPSSSSRVTNGLAPFVMRRNSVDSEGSADVVVTDNGLNFAPDLHTEIVNTKEVPQKLEPTPTESQLTPAEESVVEKPTEVMDTSESDPVDIMDIDESEGKAITESDGFSTEKSVPDMPKEVLENKLAEVDQLNTIAADNKTESLTEIGMETETMSKNSEHEETSDVVVEQATSEPAETFTSLSDQVDV